MPKKKKTSSAKKKSTMKELTQTDGMAKEEGQVAHTSLDQVWGDDGVSTYKTMDENVYSDSIDGMAKADLKTEAVRVGLLPIDNTDQLRIRLMRQFRAHVSEFNRPLIQPQENPLEMSEEARKILSEGK